MSVCEFKDACPTMGVFLDLSVISKYCRGDFDNCTRHRLAKWFVAEKLVKSPGIQAVPPNLRPNENLDYYMTRCSINRRQNS